MIMLNRQINPDNPPEYNILLAELYECNCTECHQTASIHRHQIIQKLSKLENAYRNIYTPSINDIIETKDGNYKIIYIDGPLSCSVAGGMTLLIQGKNNKEEYIYLPPNWTLEKI